MKTLDKDDIVEVFNKLIEDNGETTSLEVKKVLRSKGFWATQAQIGTALIEIAEEQDNEWVYNGVHRTYNEPDTNMSPTSVLPANAALNKLISGLKPTAAPRKAADPVDRLPLPSGNPGDWRCSEKDHSSPLYFTGSLTAPQARYAYALQTGIDYVDVRSSIVS